MTKFHGPCIRSKQRRFAPLGRAWGRWDVRRYTIITLQYSRNDTRTKFNAL